MNTEHRTQNTEHRTQNTEHRTQNTEHYDTIFGFVKAPKLLIVVPTYNEKENIEPFLKAVFENIPEDAEIIVTDDNSPDGTAHIVEDLIPNYSGRLYILHHGEKQGLGKAYLAAFAWGLSRQYDAFLEIDADFSHDPKYIPIMLNELQTFDVVIGSRNIQNGGVEGWSALRNLISKGGSLYSRMILGCPVKDLTGGFTMWRKDALLKIGLDKIISRGYLFQVELKYRAFCMGCSIKEIPIIFLERKLGKSKMSKKIFFEALLNVWIIRKNAGNVNAINQFIKFSITGIFGTVTNLLIFFFCVDRFNLLEIPVSILCFLIAATQNYIINHKWSFKQNTADQKPSFKKWVMFIVVSSCGLAVNIIVLETVLSHFTLPFKFIAQAAGIACGMVINFIFSKFIVFRRDK
jgi:dolichol-phosphate mannosyltransferase